MNSLPSRKKEWVLTPEAFNKLLASLDPDRERAAEKYENIRRKLVKFFEWRGSMFPEDHADETINRVSRKIDEGEGIADLTTYFYGVARMLLMEILKAREKERVALDCQPPPHSGESEPRLDCLERCMQNLPAESRELIIQYYREEKRAKIEKRKGLALRLGIPLNALRIRAQRIREKLEVCVNDCLK